MFFSSANRERVKEQTEGCTFGEVAKFLGAEWGTMDAKGKAPYEKEAAADKKRYEAAMKKYTPPA